MKMVASSSPAPVMVQTNTYNMNENPQNRPCLHRCLPCSICLTVMSCFIIATGAAILAIASTRMESLSDSLYESFPELKSSAQRQLYGGIAVVVVGVSLMIVSVIWCCYIKRRTSTSVMYSGTTMTTTTIAQPSASSPWVVRPPDVKGTCEQPTYVYSYEPSSRPESIKHDESGSNHPPDVQSLSNQYPPAQSVRNQYRHHHAQPSPPPPDSPNQPPPSYNELMQVWKKSTVV